MNKGFKIGNVLWAETQCTAQLMRRKTGLLA
jgi:hypothetical protein